MILGLDVSTSATGFAVIDLEGELVSSSYVDTRNKRKFPDIFEVCLCIRQELERIKEKFDIESIHIEESLQSFRSGFSSAKTLSVLSKINGMTSLMCFEIFSIKPEHVNSATARKLCGIKVPRGKNAKEHVLRHVLGVEPNFIVEYTRNGTHKPYCYDKADAYVVAKSAWIACRAAQ